MFEKKLDSAFKYISQEFGFDEELGTSLSEIERSSDAKQLGHEVEKLMEFTTKTAFLFFPYNQLFGMLGDYLDSPPVQEEIKKTEIPVNRLDCKCVSRTRIPVLV